MSNISQPGVAQARAPAPLGSQLAAVAIPANAIRGPGGAIVPPPNALAGLGINIGPSENLAINALVSITGAGGEANINADVLWYYSYDDVTYYLFATTPLIEAPVAGNPSGYIAAGGTMQRAIAQPLTAFNVYIAVAVRNNDAVNAITATVDIARQV